MAKIHPFAGKLTPDAAEAIRWARERGTGVQELARRYNVTSSTISAVTNYHAHVPWNVMWVRLPTFERRFMEHYAALEKMNENVLASELLRQELRRFMCSP